MAVSLDLLPYLLSLYFLIDEDAGGFDIWWRCS
jgi:hypothetical protein